MKYKVTMRKNAKNKESGDYLLSRDPAVQVPSALESLTAVFGMGTGVASPLLSPDNISYFVVFEGVHLQNRTIPML